MSIDGFVNNERLFKDYKFRTRKAADQARARTKDTKRITDTETEIWEHPDRKWWVRFSGVVNAAVVDFTRWADRTAGNGGTGKKGESAIEAVRDTDYDRRPRPLSNNS